MNDPWNLSRKKICINSPANLATFASFIQDPSNVYKGKLLLKNYVFRFVEINK